MSFNDIGKNIKNKGEEVEKKAATSYVNDIFFDGGASGHVMNGGESEKAIESAEDSWNMGYTATHSDLYKAAIHGANLFDKDEIDLYHKIYRFGLYNPYNSITNLREYLFFTKPDLNIIARDDITGEFGTSNKSFSAASAIKNAITNLSGGLSPGLITRGFWTDLVAERPNIVEMLQNSLSPNWNMLLQNSVISNLEIPTLEGTSVETAVNNYGVGFHYRGTSEASNDSIDFSLEFKDTKWLDVYTFFKAYDDYEVLKHHGVVSPWQGYIMNKVLHDQFSIYKFVVGEDMETLVYWSKLYGVMPMNVPRDVFSNTEMSNGLSFTINFKAAFIEDMTKDILIDFNMLNEYFLDQGKNYYQYETFNSNTGTGDFRPACTAYVNRYVDKNSPTGWVYKLKWKGDVKY